MIIKKTPKNNLKNHTKKINYKRRDENFWIENINKKTYNGDIMIPFSWLSSFVFCLSPLLLSMFLVAYKTSAY